MQLFILSGGAAHGLVTALAGDLQAETGATIAGTFGAVGAMREALISGARVDLLILTRAMIAGLQRENHILAGSARDIGVVRTVIAVRAGDALPLVGSSTLLKAALLASDEFFVPDMRQSTAGVHIALMLNALGIADAMTARLRERPNGATAMAALARATSPHPIGCTQVTEILDTPGISLVAALPAEHELATVYTAALATKAVNAGLAAHFAGLLTAPAARDLRARAGFEAA